MKKITYLTCSFVLLIVINSCVGYEPIFGSKNINFNIANYSIEGNKILGKKIYSKLFNLSKSKINNQDVRNIDLYINVSKSKITTSKNNAGKIIEYKINLNTVIKIEDNTTGKEILNQSFFESLNYKVQDQYSKTLNIENQSIENLINNIYQDFIITIF